MEPRDAGSRIEEILETWFTAGDDQARIAAEQHELWWGKGHDEPLRARFGADLDRALRGELAGWAASARGRLALIVLLDQIARSVHRGMPRAFAGDAAALALSQEGIAGGHERELRHIERVFLYMPLEHAEDREVQARSVACFKALAAEAEGPLRPIFEGYVDYAERHREIIERFGRFPHRNAILGRQPTPEEIAFLKQPGSSF